MQNNIFIFPSLHSSSSSYYAEMDQQQEQEGRWPSWLALAYQPCSSGPVQCWRTLTPWRELGASQRNTRPLCLGGTSGRKVDLNILRGWTYYHKCCNVSSLAHDPNPAQTCFQTVLLPAIYSPWWKIEGFLGLACSQAWHTSTGNPYPTARYIPGACLPFYKQALSALKWIVNKMKYKHNKKLTLETHNNRRDVQQLPITLHGPDDGLPQICDLIHSDKVNQLVCGWKHIQGESGVPPKTNNKVELIPTNVY